MADNDPNNDEYTFSEFDSLDNDPIDPGLDKSSEPRLGGHEPKKDIKRNALIALGLIFFAVMMYKLIGYLFFSPKEKVEQDTITPISTASTTVKPTVPAALTTTPVQQVPVAVIASDDGLKQKVSAIELSQQGVRNDVNAVSQQVNSVNNNVSNLNAQIENLNQVISTLSNQLTKQSEEISVLMARTQPRPVKKPIVKRAHTPAISYYLQAVIPGRAWLIGTNGSTLTVREGTIITGYGTVKLIDSLQGRVLTSSGRVIRFSQADS